MKLIVTSLVIAIVPMTFMAYRENPALNESVKFGGEFIRQAVEGL